VQTLTIGRPLVLGAGGIVLAVVLAAGVAWNPLFLTGAVIAGIVLYYGFLFPARLQYAWALSLGAILAGYAFLDRGFAYVGVPPLYVGELVLLLGILAAVVGGGFAPVLRSPVLWLLIAFAVEGVLRTAPYWSTYGVDALRDGVIWEYGSFAILVAAFLLRARHLATIPDIYRRWLPWFLFWVPAAIAVQKFAPTASPLAPGSAVPLLALKSGDVAVHLAGIASFLLLGLHQFGAPRSRPNSSRLLEWMCWLAWIVAALGVSSSNRGGLLAILGAVTVVLAIRPMSRSGHAGLFRISYVAVVLTLVFVLFNIQLDAGEGRQISPQQIAANLASVVGSSGQSGLQGTRDWRLQWWQQITKYTVVGPYFWTGKGYGINLADADGFQVNADGSLRDPHNGHMDILARTGVPGLALWVALQSTFGVSLVRAYLRARRGKREWWARLNLWILAYWLAFLINMSFDVYLEGPQGGIWFWSLMGFGIAALERQRSAQAGVQPVRESGARTQPATMAPALVEAGA